jgi:hypothetical protein
MMTIMMMMEMVMMEMMEMMMMVMMVTTIVFEEMKINGIKVLRTSFAPQHVHTHARREKKCIRSYLMFISIRVCHNRR